MTDEITSITAKDIVSVNRMSTQAASEPDPEKNKSNESEKSDSPEAATASTTEKNKETGANTEKDTPASSTQTSASTEKPAEKNFDTLLNETSKGKFKNYQELTETLDRLNKNQKTNQDELDNDLIKKFKEFRTGRREDAKAIARLFLETQLLDADELEPMAVMKHKMKLDHPGRTDADIDFLLKNKYKLDAEEHDEDTVRLSKLQLEDDAAFARKELKELQQKTALSQQTESQTERAEKIKEANQKWEKDVDNSLQGYDKIELPINDKGDKFSFSVENKEELKNIMSDLPGFWQRYINEDGSENIGKLRFEMTILSNLDKIIKVMSENLISKGRDEVLNERKNVSEKDGQQVTPTGTQKSELQEIAEGLAAKMKKR